MAGGVELSRGAWRKCVCVYVRVGDCLLRAGRALDFGRLDRRCVTSACNTGPGGESARGLLRRPRGSELDAG